MMGVFGTVKRPSAPAVQVIALPVGEGFVHPYPMTGSELIGAHQHAWRQATQHAFLDGVRGGSLPEIAFRIWLAQDYLFVVDLLRFQARLLTVAPRAGQRVLAQGLVALEAELSWFESHAARLRLQLDVEPHPVTQAYRRRLLSYVADWPCGITALWTGERGYLEAWRAASPGAPRYREFVEHWTHPDFTVYVAELERLVDSAGPDQEAFLAVCALERDFWEMAWSSVNT